MVCLICNRITGVPINILVKSCKCTNDICLHCFRDHYLGNRKHVRNLNCLVCNAPFLNRKFRRNLNNNDIIKYHMPARFIYEINKDRARNLDNQFGPMMCPRRCGKEFFRLEYRDHVKVCGHSIKICEHCKGKYWNEDKHMKNCPDLKQCPFCSKSFFSDIYDYHVSSCEPEESLSKCPFCSKGYKGIESHIVDCMYRPKTECTSCLCRIYDDKLSVHQFHCFRKKTLDEMKKHTIILDTTGTSCVIVCRWGDDISENRYQHILHMYKFLPIELASYITKFICYYKIGVKTVDVTPYEGDQYSTCAIGIKTEKKITYWSKDWFNNIDWDSVKKIDDFYETAKKNPEICIYNWFIRMYDNQLWE